MGFRILNDNDYWVKARPSHGGRDSGAISSTFLEKDMNLLLSQKLEEVLVSKGAVVYLTRDGDYDLSNTLSIKSFSIVRFSILIVSF